MLQENSQEIQALPYRERQSLQAMHDNKAISLYDWEYFEGIEFRQRILGWCAIANINTPPDDIMLQLIVDTLRNDFGGLTFAEIELALKMNALEEFEKPIETYNHFSLAFIGKVISQYKKTRKNAQKEYEEILRKRALPARVELTEEQTEDVIAEAIVNDYAQWRAGQEVWGLATKYDFLEKIGMFIPSAEAKKAAFEQAKVIVTDSRGPEWAAKNSDKLESYAILSAKELLVKGWFSEMTEFHGTDISLLELIQEVLTERRNVRS